MTGNLIRLAGCLIAMAPFYPSWPPSEDQEAGRKAYRKTTIESILKSGKRRDGARVELNGRIIFGKEASVFTDNSTCQGLGLWACSLWLDLAPECTATNAHSCYEFLVSAQETIPGTSSFIVKDVILRGTVETVRQDITYDKSVPKSARRIGFGHLSVYPGRITVDEFELGRRVGKE